MKFFILVVIFCFGSVPPNLGGEDMKVKFLDGACEVQLCHHPDSFHTKCRAG